MKSSSEIEEICRKYKIYNYTINDDGSIDVDGRVDLNDMKLTELPLKFNRVNGSFLCKSNKLTSLEFGPIEVGGSFYCDYNSKLTSLEHGPKKVGSNFSCTNNKLTSLEFSPVEVGGDFYCDRNPKLYNLYGISDNINGFFYCYNTPIGSIFNQVNIDFIKRFDSYKIIKDKEVNLKRLKYLMEISGMDYDLEKIKEHYEIN